MVEYTKQWLSVQQQIDLLAEKGVEIGDRDRAETLLKAIGYYRLTGYLYPFRESEPSDEGDRSVRDPLRQIPSAEIRDEIVGLEGCWVPRWWHRRRLRCHRRNATGYRDARHHRCARLAAVRESADDHMFHLSLLLARLADSPPAEARSTR